VLFCVLSKLEKSFGADDRYTLGFAVTYLDLALSKDNLASVLKNSIHLPVVCYLLACKVRVHCIDKHFGFK
jgi:hypothetical protein